MTSTKKTASGDLEKTDVPWKTFEEKNKKYITIGNEIFLILDEIDDSCVNKKKSGQLDENFNNTKTCIETKKNSSSIIPTDEKNNREFRVNAVSENYNHAKPLYVTTTKDVIKQSIDHSINTGRQLNDLPVKDKFLSDECVLESTNEKPSQLFNSSQSTFQKNNFFQANHGILEVGFEENTVADNLNSGISLLKEDSEIEIEEISPENTTIDVYSIGSFTNLCLSNQEKLVQQLIKKYKHSDKTDTKPTHHRNQANQAYKIKNGLSTLFKSNENINAKKIINKNIQSEENMSLKELKIILKKMDFNVIIKNNKYILETNIKDKNKDQCKKIISQKKTESEGSSKKVPKSIKVVLPKIKSFSHICTTMVENKVKTVNIPENAYNFFNKDGHPTENSDLKIICSKNGKRDSSFKVKKRKNSSQETYLKKSNKLAKISSEVFKMESPINCKKIRSTLTENSKKQPPLLKKNDKKIKNEKSTLFSFMAKDPVKQSLQTKNNLCFKKNENDTKSVMPNISFKKQVSLNNENSQEDPPSEISTGKNLRKTSPQIKYVKKVKESFAEVLAKISEQELNSHMKNIKKSKGGSSKKLSNYSKNGKNLAVTSESKKSESNFCDIHEENSERKSLENQFRLYDESSKKHEENSINNQNNTLPVMIKNENLSCAEKTKEIEDNLFNSTTDSSHKTSIIKGKKITSNQKRMDRLIVSTSLWGSPKSHKIIKNGKAISSHELAHNQIHKGQGSSVTHAKGSETVKQRKAKESLVAHKVRSSGSVSVFKSIAQEYEQEGSVQQNQKQPLNSNLFVDSTNNQVYLGSSN